MGLARDMTVQGKAKVWRTAAGALAVVAALGLTLGVCYAGGVEGMAGDHHGLRATLANVTVLSDAAMSQETGGRLQNPTVGKDGIGRQPVLLWDEMRPKVPAAPASGSGVTITVNGPGN